MMNRLELDLAAQKEETAKLKKVKFMAYFALRRNVMFVSRNLYSWRRHRPTQIGVLPQCSRLSLDVASVEGVVSCC